MTYDELKYDMESMPEILAYYISYKETENITTNVHGEYPGEFEEHMAHIVDIAEVKSDLPIERIVFYHDGNANAYVRNGLWNGIDCESFDSHCHINIPYIDGDGKFYEFSNKKVYISKDGRNISDFANEKEALMWFAENEGVDVCYEKQRQ